MSCEYTLQKAGLSLKPAQDSPRIPQDPTASSQQHFPAGLSEFTGLGILVRPMWIKGQWQPLLRCSSTLGLFAGKE